MADPTVRIGIQQITINDCGEAEGRNFHQDLQAGVLWIDDGADPVAVITVDQGGMKDAAVATVKNLVGKTTGLAADHMVILSSHTHSGLKLDPTRLGTALGAAADTARQQAVPALFGAVRVNTGRRFWVNRRVYAGQKLGTFTIVFNRGTKVNTDLGSVDAREQVADFLTYGVNTYTPDYADNGVKKGWGFKKKPEAVKQYLKDLPDPLALEGPVDPHLEAMVFKREDGSTIGSVVRAAAHPVIFHKNNKDEISPDYPGVFTREVAAATGVPALFVNGPCGNTKPVIKEYGLKETERYGKELAALITGALEDLQTEPLSRFRCIRFEEEFDIAAGMMGQDEVKFQTAVEEYEKAVADAEDPADIKKKVEHCMHIWGARHFNHAEPKLRLPFMLMGFNDTALLSLPGEIFAEHSLEIKRHFPDRQVIIAELADANGPGYVPVIDAFARGGYEPNVAMLDMGSGEKMALTAVKMLALLYLKK